MARKFGEPPGQTRSYNSRRTGGRMTAAQRKKQRDRAKKRGGDGLMSLPANVVKYYRDNPAMLVEDVMVGIPGLSGMAIGNKVSRGDNADAALSAAALVPGVGVLGKGAKVASVASKASKAGTATVKKTTKAVAAAKKPPRKPKKVVDKGRKQNIDKMNEAQKRKDADWQSRLPRPKEVKNPAPPVKPKSQIKKQRDRDLKKFDDATGGRYKPRRPQPKKSDTRTDAPGTGGGQKPRPKKKLPYKAEGPTNKTKAQIRKERLDKGAKEVEETRGGLKPQEVQDILGGLGFKPRSQKSAAEIVAARKPGAQGKARRASKKDEAAEQKKSADQKRSESKRRTEDEKRRGDEYRTGTPEQKTRRDVQTARLKKAGAERPNATDSKFGGRKKDGSQALADVELPDISAMGPASLRSLRRQLEKRVRRGNANEQTVQLLNEVREKLGTESVVKGLMRPGMRSKGRGQPTEAPGMVNPPRKPKASNQKWRGEGGKDAPKAPGSQAGRSKRGDKITENTKGEDGVTRNKGKGGQRRRQVAPSQELVPTRKPTTRGRRSSGSSSSGSRPIALGSGRSRGGRLTPSDRAARRQADEPRVVQGEVVKGGRGTSGRQGGERVREPIDLKTRPRGGSGGGRSRPKAIGTGGRLAIGSGAAKANKGKKGMSKKKKVLAGAAIGTAAVGGFLSGVGDAAKEQAKDEKPTPKKRRDTLRDKYGRQISREEYNKREAYRERLKSMTPAEKKRARKQEMKRREEYRKGEGAQKFGKGADTIIRNLDLREGVSSRMVNKKTRERYAKSKDKTRSGKQQARNEIRSKYRRKKKK